MTTFYLLYLKYRFSFILFCSYNYQNPIYHSRYLETVRVIQRLQQTMGKQVQLFTGENLLRYISIGNPQPRKLNYKKQSHVSKCSYKSDTKILYEAIPYLIVFAESTKPIERGNCFILERQRSLTFPKIKTETLRIVFST